MIYKLFSSNKFLWWFAIVLALLVYAAGMLVTIMEIDGAVYAEISREMFRNGNYFELYHHGNDWLDKPHFQFWITALSFKIFGLNSIGYKLPAILFMLIGAYYTYLFGKRFYSKKHGYLAALILMTSQHIITSNSDVRAEPYLTGFTILSLYYLTIFIEDKKGYQLIAGSLGLSCLLMTKGLFTIIPVASGIGLALLYNKNWKQIVHWQWLAIGLLTLTFIVPTLYGYYTQFDCYPGKIIFGQQNVSGIKFFFWDSQWGRFTNTGPIKGSGDSTFFLHTMLWAYLPWAFVAYFAIFNKAKSLWKKTNISENYTFFGFIFLFIVFSISSFQLPHYLNALFPFLSIITADVLLRYAKNKKFLAIFYHIQIWSSAILMLAIALIQFYFSAQFPRADFIIIFILAALVISILISKKGNTLKKIIFVPAITVLLANYYINSCFYPQLLKYQAESEVAFFMKENNLNDLNLVTLGVNEEMVSFLHDKIIPRLNPDSALPNELTNRYVFTDKKGVEFIDSLDIGYKEIQVFPDFRITTLNGTFFNKKTREQSLEIKYLLKTSK